MDQDVVLSAPLATVYARLADPARLGDWLPRVVQVHSRPAPEIGLGSAFTVTLRVAGVEQEVGAEIVAHEPSWLVAYRLMIGGDPLVIRVACTNSGDGTRVRVQQTKSREPLGIDLDGIRAVVEAHPDGRPADPGARSFGVPTYVPELNPDPRTTREDTR